MSIRKKPTSGRREKAENKGFEPTSGDFENKIRFSLWLKPQTMEEIEIVCVDDGSIDNSLSNGRYAVVGGGSKSGMVAVDGNTGGVRYYGGEMTIFTTINYPVKES